MLCTAKKWTFHIDLSNVVDHITNIARHYIDILNEGLIISCYLFSLNLWNVVFDWRERKSFFCAHIVKVIASEHLVRCECSVACDIICSVHMAVARNSAETLGLLTQNSSIDDNMWSQQQSRGLCFTCQLSVRVLQIKRRSKIGCVHACVRSLYHMSSIFVFDNDFFHRRKIRWVWSRNESISVDSCTSNCPDENLDLYLILSRKYDVLDTRARLSILFVQRTNCAV